MQEESVKETRSVGSFKNYYRNNSCWCKLTTDLESVRAQYLREKGDSQDLIKAKDVAFVKK